MACQQRAGRGRTCFITYLPSPFPRRRVTRARGDPWPAAGRSRGMCFITYLPFRLPLLTRRRQVTRAWGGGVPKPEWLASSGPVEAGRSRGMYFITYLPFRLPLFSRGRQVTRAWGGGVPSGLPAAGRSRADILHNLPAFPLPPLPNDQGKGQRRAVQGGCAS